MNEYTLCVGVQMVCAARVRKTHADVTDSSSTQCCLLFV